MRITASAVRWVFIATAALAAVAGHAQDYPVKPIRIVVPVPPGGANDTLTRFVALKLTDALRQSVLVDNRPGGSTTVGIGAVARSAPDGYVLLMAPSTITVNNALYASLPYHPIKDFTPVSTIAAAPLVLVVHPSLPVRSVSELVKLARSKPGEMNYASAGNGTSSHLAAELFKNLTGTSIVHIPYKGGAQAATDLAGGRVLMMFGTVQSSMPHVHAKKVRALAVTSTRRSSFAGDVPTMAEAGAPGVEIGSWFGIVGPAGLPREVVTRLDQELKQFTQLPEVKERLAAMGYETIYMPPEEFAAFLSSDLARWTKVIRQAGIKLEQ
jgi:tripartite-type tricarboxylate transporter receptor subunit TctC